MYQYQPLNSWSQFELLSKELLSKELSLDFTTHGRNGSQQNGVDSYAIKDNEYVGLQCKGKEVYPERKITKKEIVTEYKKTLNFNPSLNKLLFSKLKGTLPFIVPLVANLMKNINIK